MLLTTIISPANAALTATTANTIQGTAPKLVINGTNTEATITNIVSVIASDGTTLLSPLGTKTFSTTAGQKLEDVKPYITYLDADGDAGDSSYDSLVKYGINGVDGITYKWEDKNRREITDFTEGFSGCLSPYELTVTATNAQAVSSYGNPLTSTVYGSNPSVTYKFTAPTSAGGCIKYLQPGNMQTFTGTAGGNIKFAAGYNPTAWDVGKGFKASSGFPTTGFKGAKFSLVGSGSNQSNYRCKSTNGTGKISLSTTSGLGADCTVTYTTADKSAFISGSTTPTITMEYNTGGSTWVAIDSYTIPTPTKWAIGGMLRMYGNQNPLSSTGTGGFLVLDYCRTMGSNASAGITTTQEATGQSSTYKLWRQKYLYRRNEFTNSPHAYRAELNGIVHSTNYFSRDVDGTFMGEWGRVRDYANSPWTANTYYWAAEAWSVDGHSLVNTDGYVIYPYPNNTSCVAVCRGE